MDSITKHDNIADQPDPQHVMAIAQLYSTKAAKLRTAIDVMRRTISTNGSANMLSVFTNLLKSDNPEESQEYIEQLLPFYAGLPLNDDATDDGRLQNARDLADHLDFQSAEYYKKYIELDPDNLYAYHMLIYLFGKLNDVDNGLKYAEIALKLEPDNYLTYGGMGDLYYFNRDKDEKYRLWDTEAAECYEKSLQLNPNRHEYFPHYLPRLGDIYYHCSRAHDALTCFQTLFSLDPKNPQNLFNIGFYSTRSGLTTQADIYKLASESASAYIRANEIEPMAHVPDPGSVHKKLHIGYLSSDFGHHVVMYFFEPILQNYNKETFTVSCYSNLDRPDDYTRRCKDYVDRFIEINNITSDKELAEMIKRDNVDILVDLCGYTSSSRVSVMPYKPAPVQVSYLGYPNTTGMTAIDYILTDKMTILPSESELYSEKPFYLDYSYEVFNIIDEYLAPITPLPALENGYITFGFFNCLSKINLRLIETFACILRAVEGSKLLIHRYKMPTCSRQWFLDLFGQFGIAPERLILSAENAYIEFMAKADIALDSFPYNGTTTIESMLQGLPVICLYGDGAHGRASARINTKVGLPQLIAQSVCQYIFIAQELSRDIDKLSSLRCNLRQMLKDSPIGDHKGFVRCLEDGYHTMWRTWCRHHENAER